MKDWGFVDICNSILCFCDSGFCFGLVLFDWRLQVFMMLTRSISWDFISKDLVFLEL